MNATDPLTASRPSSSARRDALALLFAMAFPTVMSWLDFMVVPNLAPEYRSKLGLVFALGKFVQFGFPLLYLWYFDRAWLRWPPMHPRGLTLALAFGALVGAAMMILYFGVLKDSVLFEQANERVQKWMEHLKLPSRAGFLVMAAFVAVIHSLWEEYYWRWFVFGRMRQWMPWPAALVIAGLAFMSHHVVVLMYYLPGYFWVAVVPFALGVAVGGMVWAWMYQRNGSILATWASHCVVDIAIMVVGYDLLSRQAT